MPNTNTTIKVAYHHSDAGFCKTIFKEVNGKRYFNRHDGGGWYTCYPSNGYYESCSPISDSDIIEVVDKKGKVLFTESNFKQSNMLSIDEMAKEKSLEIRNKFNLKKDGWFKWICSYMERYDFKDYDDNWAYFYVDTVSEETIEKFSYLGMKFEVIKLTRRQRMCGKEWIIYMVQNIDSDETEAICGNVWSEDDDELDTLLKEASSKELKSKQVVLYRGITCIDSGNFQYELPSIFKEKHEWRDGGFRKVWVSEQHNAIVTYCEGDYTVVLCNTKKAFEDELANCEKCYVEDENENK